MGQTLTEYRGIPEGVFGGADPPAGSRKIVSRQGPDARG
jgi:hypothetical protein